jgi:hypothetical protein
MEFAFEFGKTVTSEPVKKIFEEDFMENLHINKASQSP